MEGEHRQFPVVQSRRSNTAKSFLSRRGFRITVYCESGSFKEYLAQIY